MGTYYGPDFLKPYMMAFWDTESWLNGPWSENDQNAFNLLYDFSLFRGKFDQILDKKVNAAYLSANQMTYSDVYDPRKLKSNSVGGQTINFLSSNIKRLYR